MTELVPYEAARKALAAAVKVDEAKEIRDKAFAVKIYAERAKDTQLVAHAVDLMIRAERRVGEILIAMQKSGKRQRRGSANQHAKSRAATLQDLGVSKSQSSRWQKLAAMSESDFEDKLAEHCEIVAAKAGGVRVDVRKKKGGGAARSNARPENLTLVAVANFADDGDTPEENWSRAIRDNARASIALAASLKKQFGDWSRFTAPSETVALVRQAAESWWQLINEITTKRRDAPRPPEVPGPAVNSMSGPHHDREAPQNIG
jgi:hypothetical protein